MQVARDTAHLAVVTDSERGERIQERLDALKISDREFHEVTGIDRKTLRRAVAGNQSVRPNTYRTIEDWLDRLEKQRESFAGLKSQRGDVSDPGDDLIEFRLSGNFGVDVVVKGPMRDRGELEAAVTRLLREMRGQSDSTDS
jgi:transcriptional regulator with XRE-family HTH domain